MQAWLGALTTKQLEDPDMAPNANQVFRKWKNTHEKKIVYSVNKRAFTKAGPDRIGSD